MMDELNLLFKRMRRALKAQQHFVADAAHALRSPLAALKLQLQGLQRAGCDEARAVAAGRLAAGIDRATRLVEQLLALARQEASAASGMPPKTVPPAGLARRAVADATPAAHNKDIDLGVVSGDAVAVLGYADALRRAAQSRGQRREVHPRWRRGGRARA